MLKKNAVVFLLFFVALSVVYSQDDAARLLNLVDGILNSAEERLAPSQANQAANSPSLQIFNDTGFTVRAVYVCKTDDNDWGKNFLQNPLLNGQRIAVNLDQPVDDTSLYNIRMVDVDGDRYSKYNLRLRSRSTVRMGISDFEWDK